MRMYTKFATIFVVLIFALTKQTVCSGVFELRLDSFSNDYGKDSTGRCCSGEKPPLLGECSGPCLTRFRICLRHYEVNIDMKSPCTFGDVMTPVLGHNSLQISDSINNLNGFTNPVTFKFNFTWPRTFSLILEAWHEDENTYRTNGSPNRTLITRLTTQGSLDPDEGWTKDEHVNNHSKLKYEYRVTCDSHYYGSGCANFCRQRDDQFGHYTCAPNGARVCLTGWEGAYCEKPKCLPGCNEPHGHCEKPDQCLCHRGWQGKYCNECERYPGCLHGTCQKEWECICKEGWGGLFCNQDLNYCTNHKPCKHGGTCFNTGQGSYTCKCPPGFTGIDCELPVNGCSKNPCLNNGVCKEYGNGYSCMCPTGYRGDHCEVSTLTCRDVYCMNNATCDDTNVGFQCRCKSGYTGLLCDQEVDDCNPNPCQNNAACRDQVNGYVCLCPVGFTGPNCQTNIDDCLGQTCLNGGTCIDMINHHRCQCVPGYVGDRCEGKVDYCVAKPCAYGATCKNLVNDYECVCRPGFKGKDCSIDIDECKSSPCMNGATCIQRVNNYECLCPEGFSGKRCDGNNVTNMSKHISERADDTGLSTEQVVIIATFSTAVPLLVLVGAVVVMCMKQKRKREQQKADDEARKQNERNIVHSSINKRVGVGGDTHVIKNTWGKTVNNDSGVSISDNIANSELCYTKQSDPGPVYTLLRTRSQKQLNTDTALHRQSQRCSVLLAGSDKCSPQQRSSSLMTCSKLDKDIDNLCSPHPPSSRATEQRISILSVDSSLCNTSETQLVKRPYDKESQNSLISNGTTTPNIYVIEDHYLHTNGVIVSGVTMATQV